MNFNNIHTGVVATYDRQKHIGFIEMQDGMVAFFYFDREMQNRFVRDGGNPAHKFSYGDELEFRLKVSPKDSSKWEAYDLQFIRNQRTEQLLSEAKENPVLRGYIKKLNTGKWMVKHASSYVFIPLLVSDWEIDKEALYDARVDEIVEFRLTQTKDIYKLEAVLTDAKFSPEYEELSIIQANQTIIQATLVSRNEDGYFATLLDGKVDAFIPIIGEELTDKEKEALSSLKKGDNLPATIKRIYPNRRVSLKLTVS